MNQTWRKRGRASYTRREAVVHAFRGCRPSPRPPSGTWVWTARWCRVCGRYPCGPWRLGGGRTDVLRELEEVG